MTATQTDDNLWRTILHDANRTRAPADPADVICIGHGDIPHVMIGALQTHAGKEDTCTDQGSFVADYVFLDLKTGPACMWVINDPLRKDFLITQLHRKTLDHKKLMCIICVTLEEPWDVSGGAGIQTIS